MLGPQGQLRELFLRRHSMGVAVLRITGPTFRVLPHRGTRIRKCRRRAPVNTYLLRSRLWLSLPSTPIRRPRLTWPAGHQKLSQARILVLPKRTVQVKWIMSRPHSERLECAVRIGRKINKPKRRNSHQRCLRSASPILRRHHHHRRPKARARSLPNHPLLIDIPAPSLFRPPPLSPSHLALSYLHTHTLRVQAITPDTPLAPCNLTRWAVRSTTRWAVPYTTLHTFTVRCIILVIRSMERIPITHIPRLLCIMGLLRLMGYPRSRLVCRRSHSCSHR